MHKLTQRQVAVYSALAARSIVRHGCSTECCCKAERPRQHYQGNSPHNACSGQRDDPCRLGFGGKWGYTNRASSEKGAHRYSTLPWSQTLHMPRQYVSQENSATVHRVARGLISRASCNVRGRTGEINWHDKAPQGSWSAAAVRVGCIYKAPIVHEVLQTFHTTNGCKQWLQRDERWGTIRLSFSIPTYYRTSSVRIAHAHEPTLRTEWGQC